MSDNSKYSTLINKKVYKYLLITYIIYNFINNTNGGDEYYGLEI